MSEERKPYVPCLIRNEEERFIEFVEADVPTVIGQMMAMNVEPIYRMTTREIVGYRLYDDVLFPDRRPSPPVVDGELWQPIETAPRDGTHVLLAGRPYWSEISWVGSGRFVTDAGQEGEWWETNNDPTDTWGGELSGVTHWQPLPAPPKSPRSEGDK